MKREEYDVMYRVEDRHWWFAGMRDIAAAVLARAVRPGSLRILDAGCGTGRNLVELGRLGDAVGVDVSADALRLSRARGLARLARASIVHLPFPDGTFDLATSFDVLSHGAVGDEHAALAELARVLRPGGHLLLHLPAYGWLLSRHDRAVENVRRYTAGRARALLEGAGLAIERLTYANTVLFPLALLQRLATRTRSSDGGSDVATTTAVDGALRAALALEARLLRHVDLPFGLTVVALARRPLSAPAPAR